MATINEITNADSYRGDAALGGYGGTPFEVSKDAINSIQQLNQYTFLYNKSQYDQRQKDADQKIKQLGDLAPYDLVNGIEKDKKELQDAQAKLEEEMAAFAAKGTPKTPKEKINQQLEFQTKIQGQLKLINAANARKIKLDIYTNAVQADNKLSAQEKELRINQAKELFNQTDIFTLPEIPNHDLTIPKNGEPLIESVNVIKTGADGNSVIDESIKQFSIGNNWKTSYMDANNFNIPVLPENATQQQKNEYEQKKLAFARNGVGAWGSAAEFYNHALSDPNYKKTITTDISVTGEGPATKLTEQVDIDKVRASNPIVGGIVALAERYNNYAAKRLQDINNGYYIDTVTGEKVLLVGGDKADDVKFIDVTKPLKPEDLSFLDKFAKAAPDQVEKKFIQTDNAIQRENNLLDFRVQWKNAETARMNALKPDAKGEKNPEEVIDKPAILFGQHIDRLKETFKKNGGKPIQTGFPGIDANTRIATGIQEDQKIIYNPDGSFEIKDKKGNSVKVGLIENLAQGFINAVKTIDLAGKDKDGTMAEGFQLKSENKFKQLWGTTSGKTIWDGWESKTTTPTTTTTTTVTTTGNDISYYNSAENVKSESGNTITYKDGTVWEIKDGKLKKIK